MSPRTKAAVQLTVDGRQLTAREGETVLDVARREGIDIPALCHQEGMAAWGACRLCMVEVEGLDKLQAACTTWVKDGQVVKTDTKRVRARRESYLKMYLSDHNAYCEAPCSHACPTHIDIPAYMAALASGDAAGAASIVRDELPFPGILGRVCPRYCEPVCRRGDVDEPIAICALHRAAADHSDTLLVPGVPTGRRVAVIGAGPAGLAAAWFLTQGGHEVTIYDANEEPGGIAALQHPRVPAARKGRREGAHPAVGRRRALRRRVRARLRGRPGRALRRRVRRGRSSASAPGRSPSTSSPATTPPSTASSCSSACARAAPSSSRRRSP